MLELEDDELFVEEICRLFASKGGRMILWDMMEPYRRPKSFTPLVCIYICAFYTGVIGAAITEQLYKEKFWEEHTGVEVPIMKMFMADLEGYTEERFLDTPSSVA